MAEEKRGRGRPSVLHERYGYDRNTVYTFKCALGGVDARGAECSNRFFQNHVYMAEALTKLVDASATKIKNIDLLVPKEEGKKAKVGVLEQLGRLLMQDNCSDEEFYSVASKAAQALHDGQKSKQVEKTVRSYRKLRKEILAIEMLNNGSR